MNKTSLTLLTILILQFAPTIKACADESELMKILDEDSYPLHYLAQQRDKNALQMMEAFLIAGKQTRVEKHQPDHRDPYDRTPMHVAAARGNDAAVRLLLAHGGDGTPVDNAGRTPFDVTKSAEVQELLAIFQPHLDLTRRISKRDFYRAMPASSHTHSGNEARKFKEFLEERKKKGRKKR